MGTADDAPQGPVIIRQTVFVFPREQFDPNYVRLVIRGRDPATAVACLLGFFKLVCEDGYKEMLRASCLDGNWLDEVDVGRLSGAPVRRQLRALSDDSEPRATMDDFYVLLGVLLRNLACVPDHPLRHYWFLKRVAELVKLFPGVSEPPPVPLYSQVQADAVSNFGQRWPHTRAALCRALLGSQFEGPMRQLQEYVTESWRFAGMKHVYLILKFLGRRNSWALDIIPEVRARGAILQDFLEAYLRLGAEGPYMNLLHLTEAELGNRRCLGIHVAAAYAFAVFEDKYWLRYKGVSQDQAEEVVLAKIRAIKRMGLGAPPKYGPSAARFGVRRSHGETRTTTRSQKHRQEDRDVRGSSTATTPRFKRCEATPSFTTRGQQQGRFPGPRLPGQHGPSSPVPWPVACRSATSIPPHRFAAPRIRIHWPAKTQIVSKLE